MCALVNLSSSSSYSFFYSSSSSSSPLGPVSINSPVRTAALGLLCHPKFCIQPRFRSPVPRMKRQRSLTVAVYMSVSSTTRIPKTL
jgi:hypothetical protein